MDKFKYLRIAELVFLFPLLAPPDAVPAINGIFIPFNPKRRRRNFSVLMDVEARQAAGDKIVKKVQSMIGIEKKCEGILPISTEKKNLFPKIT